MANFRRNVNALQDQTAEAMKQQAVSPSGVKASGGSPDAAKMQGTPAQKGAVTSAPRMQETRQQVGRITQDQAVTPQQEALKAQSESMKRLEHLGPKLQGLMAQRMQEVQAKQFDPNSLAIDETYVASQFDEGSDEYTAAMTALTNFIQNGATEDEAKILAQQLGLENLADISQFYQGSDDVILGLSQSLGAEVTIGQLPDAEFVDDQLAQDLGLTLPELQAMTVPELEQRINEVQQQNFTAIRQLQAELASLPAGSNRREDILNQLRRLAAQGVTGVEASVRQLEEDIAAGKTLNLAGEEFTLAEITQDEKLSELIGNMATNEVMLNEMLASEDEGARQLAEWVKQNQEAVSELIGAAQATATGFQDVQTQAQDWRNEIEGFEGLVEGADADLFTSEELASIQSALANNEVYKAAMSDPALGTLIRGNTELQERLKDLSADKIKEYYDLTNSLKGDNQWLYEEFGFELPDDILTDPDQIMKLTNIKNAIDRLPKGFALNFKGLIGDGQIGLEHIEYLADVAEEKGPEAMQHVWNRAQEKKARADAMSDNLKYLDDDGNLVDRGKADRWNQTAKDLGFPGADWGKIQSIWQSAAKYDTALSKKMLSLLDKNGDGKLDTNDAKRLAKEAYNAAQVHLDIGDWLTAKEKPLVSKDMSSLLNQLLTTSPAALKEKWKADPSNPANVKAAAKEKVDNYTDKAYTGVYKLLKENSLLSGKKLTLPDTKPGGTPTFKDLERMKAKYPDRSTEALLKYPPPQVVDSNGNVGDLVDEFPRYADITARLRKVLDKAPPGWKDTKEGKEIANLHHKLKAWLRDNRKEYNIWADDDSQYSLSELK